MALGSPSSQHERAVLHANRALCQLRAGDAAAALHEAEAATEAAPLWSKAWVRKAAALLALGDRGGALGAAARAAALNPEDAALLRLQTELQAELRTELQADAPPPSPAHWKTRSAAVAASASLAEGSIAEGGLLRGTAAEEERPRNLQGRGCQGKGARTDARAAAGGDVDMAAEKGVAARAAAAAAAAVAVPTVESAAWGASFAKGRASRRRAAPAPVASPWCEGGLGSALRSALSQSHWSRQLIAPLALYGVLLSWGWLRL